MLFCTFKILSLSYSTNTIKPLIICLISENIRHVNMMAISVIVVGLFIQGYSILPYSFPYFYIVIFY